jgi:hypothetical protein
MWGMAAVQLFIILLFLLFAWAIRRKKAYWLISGFSTRPKEEQQKLIENGMPQKAGTLLLFTAVGMLMLLPLVFTPFPFAMEVQFGFMLVFLLGGFIYLSKYEIAKKRKRSYLFSSLLFIGTIGLVIGLYFAGYQDYELKIAGEKFEITGLYGDEWQTSDIQEIQLLDRMPEVTWRENGFGLATMSKGRFTVEGYGSSLLFIRKDAPPYLYIKLEGQHIFINGKTPSETESWHESLRKTIQPAP